MVTCYNCKGTIKPTDQYTLSGNYAMHVGGCPSASGRAAIKASGTYSWCGQCGQVVDSRDATSGVMFDDQASLCVSCVQKLVDASKHVEVEPHYGRGGSPRFYQLLDAMGAVHAAKNHDYSTSRGGGDPFRNFRGSEKVGVPAWVGAFIRLQDKFTRCENLIALFRETGSASGKVKDETFADTIIDLANYALIVRCLYEQFVGETHARFDGDEDERAEMMNGLD